MSSASHITVNRRITRSITAELQREVKITSGEDNILQATTSASEKKKITAQASKRPRTLPYTKTVAASRTPSILAQRFGLIQERVAHSLYELLVATTLWNRTKGSQARPVFVELIKRYPTPERLSKAKEDDLAKLLQPLGLHNSRARRFLLFAQRWLDSPPTTKKRYRKLHYPSPDSGKDVGNNEILGIQDPREGWEIAHLPGVGPYALDSFRIFHRDRFRGLASDGEGTDAAALDFEPEWKRVNPLDKELKAYIRWMWLREGWLWDPSSGSKVKISAKRMKMEKLRDSSLSPELL